MKEKLESKITEILEAIMAKDVKDISYNEYRILDNKLTAIKYEEESQRKSEELSAMMAKTFTHTLSMPPLKSLPEEKEED